MMLKPILWRGYWHDLNMLVRRGFPWCLLLLWPWTYVEPLLCWLRMRKMDQKRLRSLDTAFPAKFKVIVEVQT
jgi:hypothetical protein